MSRIDKYIEMKLGKIWDGLVDEAKSLNIGYVYESDLTFKNILLGKTPLSDVEEIEYEGIFYAYKKRFNHGEIDWFQERMIANQTVALRKCNNLYPEHFIDIHKIVLSDEDKWAGILTTLLGPEYVPINMTDRINLGTVKKMGQIIRKVNKSGISCDMNPDNILIKDWDDFFFIDPVNPFFIKQYVNDWGIWETIKKNITDTSVLSRNMRPPTTRGKTVLAYFTMLRYLADS